MKIAISPENQNLDSNLDSRFRRCNYFIFIDPDSMEFEAIPNESANAMGGAGIQAVQIIVDKKVDVVITRNIGPNAF